jgi:hypothetical protein
MKLVIKNKKDKEIKIKKTIIKGETLFITNATPKAGDEMIVVRKTDPDYGKKHKTPQDFALWIDTGKYAVIVEPKKSYRVWLSVEELTEYPDGTEEYNDVEDIDACASVTPMDEPHQTLEEAIGKLTMTALKA